MEVRIKGSGTTLSKVLDRLPSFRVTKERAPSEEAARDPGTIWEPRSIAEAVNKANERLDRGFEPASKPK